MKRMLMLLDNPLEWDARVERSAKSLSRQGINVTIYAMKDDQLPFEEERSDYSIVRSLEQVLKRPFHRGYKSYVSSLVKEIKREGFDCIYCHDYYVIPIGAQVKQENPEIKLIYDAHELLSGWPYYKNADKWINRLKGYFVWTKLVQNEANAIKRADLVITVSDSIADKMHIRFHLKQAPLVIRNVPESFKTSNEHYFHEKLGIPKEKKVILHSGNIYHSRKRLKMMIEVIASIDELALVFMVDFEKQKIAREVVRSLGLEDQVYFHPYIKGEMIGTYISTADIGIVHTWNPRWESYWFSLPNRIMEYTMAGLPLVSTKQPEFVKIGEAYNHATFYNGNDMEEMKLAILKILKNYEMYKENAGKARQSLNWETESKKLSNAIQLII